MSHSSLALGLIGYPLQQSRSPELHAAALRTAGLQGEYRLYPVAPLPEGRAALENIVDLLRRGELAGLNVTIPHKQNVLPFVDELSPAALAAGAANTLWMKNDRLIGENTDIPGFLADLRQQLPGLTGNASEARHALVLGAGGSARGVVYGLLGAGWRVRLAARNLEQALTLQRQLDLPEHLDVLPLTAAELGRQLEIVLVVNTTSAGMAPQAEISPWPDNLPLPDGAAVYDLVYKPPETVLMRQARFQGLPACNGLGMLVEQAALSFECWTGVPADRQAMWQAVRN